MSPLDLHVLGTPPAFVLSQDQTLPFNPLTLSCFTLRNLRCLSLILPDKPFPLRVSSLYRFQGSLGSPATSIVVTPHRGAHSFRLTSPLKSFLPPAVFRGSPSAFRPAGELDYNTRALPPCQALFLKFSLRLSTVSVKVFQGFAAFSTSCG